MAAKPPATGGSALDRLPKGAKIGVGVGVALLLLGVYFLTLFSDVDNDIKNEQQRKGTLEQQLREATASKEAYQKDVDEKLRREQLAREQKKILPDESETPAFLSALQGVATIAGINLTSWTPQDEVPLEFYAKVPMKLTIRGKFHQLAKFFHGVGQLDRIMNTEDIQIKAVKEASKDGASDIEVESECLATAFRAVRPNETPAKGRGAGR